MKDANLNSKSETSTPDIHFVHQEEHDFPIIVFRAPRPSRTARVSSRLHRDFNSANVLQMVKFWQIQNFSKPIFGGDPFILRVEEQELHNIDNTKDAYLLLLEHAAYIPLAGKGKDDSRVQVSIVAMVIPKDSRVRWFYSVLKYDLLLEKLGEFCDLTPLKTIEPRDLSKPQSVRTKDHHARLFTWLRESFLAVLHPPHSPDYINARDMMDWAPEISMSEGEALNALAGNAHQNARGIECNPKLTAGYLTYQPTFRTGASRRSTIATAVRSLWPGHVLYTANVMSAMPPTQASARPRL